MWRCVHKIARFTLEQTSRKLNTADQNTPCSTLQISKLYNRLRFQRAFENISWLLYRLIWHVHHNMTATFLQLDDHKHNIFYKILVLWWKTAGKCAKSSGCRRWLALNLIPEKGKPIVMKAIKINETGGLSQLKYEDVPIPEPQHSEVRTRSNLGESPVWFEDICFDRIRFLEVELKMSWYCKSHILIAGSIPFKYSSH